MSSSALSASAYCSLEARVVGLLGHRHRHVVLDPKHARRGPQPLSQRFERPLADVDRKAPDQSQLQSDTTARVGDRTTLVGIAHARAELNEQAGGRPRLAARTRVTVRAEAKLRRGRRRGDREEDDGRSDRLTGPDCRVIVQHSFYVPAKAVLQSAVMPSRSLRTSGACSRTLPLPNSPENAEM